MVRALLIVLACVALSSCAVTSSLAIPECVDRLEVSGEHQRTTGRNGQQTLVFDHAFDPPLSRTDVVLQRDGREETRSVWNTRPDGGRLLVALVSGLFGGVLWASAAYDVVVQDARPLEEGPFYSAVFGTGALAFGALVGLTGWHPASSEDVDDFCVEPAVGR